MMINCGVHLCMCKCHGGYGALGQQGGNIWKVGVRGQHLVATVACIARQLHRL